MIVKEGADIRGLRPEIVLGLAVAASVYASHGLVMVITEVTGAKHMEGSLHYRGLAADLRLPSRMSYLESIDKIVLGQLKGALGPQWDVVLEKDHIHVEFDPKADTV